VGTLKTGVPFSGTSKKKRPGGGAKPEKLDLTKPVAGHTSRMPMDGSIYQEISPDISVQFMVAG
jgi:hypothetical protein